LSRLPDQSTFSTALSACRVYRHKIKAVIEQRLPVAFYPQSGNRLYHPDRHTFAPFSGDKQSGNGREYADRTAMTSLKSKGLSDGNEMS
jgi:hypothetical protein